MSTNISPKKMRFPLHCLYITPHFPTPEISDCVLQHLGPSKMSSISCLHCLPICDGLVEQAYLVLSGAAEVIDEIVAKNLAGDAVFSHESNGGFL